MAFIHPIVRNPGLTTQSPDQQLGTEGFDFMSALLGLQAASQAPEWWQVDPDSTNAGNSQQTSSFGQDAALPMPAEQVFSFSGLPTQPEQLASVPVELPELKLEKPEFGPVSQAATPMFPQESPVLSFESESIKTVPSFHELFQVPLEKLQPHELKQLVASVWGDVKEVKVENVPETPHTDVSQHKLIQALAGKTAGAQVLEQRSTFAADSKSAQTELQVRSETPSLGLSDSTEKTHSTSRVVSSDKGIVFASSGEVPQEFSTEGIAKSPESNGAPGPIHPKLIAQVAPKLESLAQQGGGRLTMELDPPELGRLTIELTTRGKNVEIQIRTDNDQTRAALEGGMADLQQALQSQELQLTNVEVHTSRESSFASMQFGQGTSQQETPSRDGGSSRHDKEERVWAREFFTQTPMTRQRGEGRLDVRV